MDCTDIMMSEIHQNVNLYEVIYIVIDMYAEISVLHKFCISIKTKQWKTKTYHLCPSTLWWKNC